MEHVQKAAKFVELGEEIPAVAARDWVGLRKKWYVGLGVVRESEKMRCLEEFPHNELLSCRGPCVGASEAPAVLRTEVPGAHYVGQKAWALFLVSLRRVPT